MEQIKALPLNAVKFFYFVAESGSLSAAAEQLHVTHGAVSKQLKILERHLGVPLFLKQGRNLVLSNSGTILYQCCRESFAGLESAVQRMQHRRRQELVISCEPTLAMKWLIPRISRFQQQYDFNPVILAAGGAVDFQRQGIDVAIRRNDFRWSPQLYAEKISEEQIGLVQRPHLTQLKKLHTHTRAQAWQNWLQVSGLENCRYQGDIYFEHFYLSIQAAIAGMGAAIASRFMVHDEIEQGILQAPHGFIADGSAYYLLSQTAFATCRNKTAFLHWLKKEMV
ncbi:LysR substrate-binding domain-containing protein [Testudinibacter aquarius]|uniref:LysR family transcriptional regulator n=1 Tax=Testudinibacter aquarius TaxID=1524974 RepID=A0A4R3YC44_9PAST|nr:LysR substrate-binding domain-containing protein [Testudinibacter aquarius]KAE9529862.1 transcriptional regulator [Testudinibacter aquarius]TCV89371.1 LysR family transcriptional regulator [Testudinibacter aquarius]TNG93151.1 LysR family transcriptional regulator [Testudinibacter aquarius]